MSYSICLRCKHMVSRYEKYCTKCEKLYKQDSLFWKTASYDIFEEPHREKELAKDEK